MTIKYFLEQLVPSQYNLLEQLCLKMDDMMLLSIAEADYGYKADHCFKILSSIRESGRTQIIDLSVKEVLELTRWRESKSEKEHLIRAFACTNLLIAVFTNDLDLTDDENATLANLIESVLVLGGPYQKSALELLAWRIFSADDENIHPFFIYAILVLLISNKSSKDKIVFTVQWLSEQEARWRKEAEIFVVDGTFLLGLTNFNQRHELWKQITRQMLKQSESINDDDLKEKISEIATYILNGKSPIR